MPIWHRRLLGHAWRLMDRILITPRSLSSGEHDCVSRLRKAGYQVVFPAPGSQPTADQIASALDGALGWVAGVEKIDAALLEKAKSLKAISRNGSGVDNIDLEAAAALGIQVFKADGANAQGVAELVFGLLLAAARDLPRTISELKAGRWIRPKGFELGGKTIGLIGCGHVGRRVAALALAFNMTVLAYDIAPDPSFSPGTGFYWTPFDELIARSDIVSLHCPALPEGRPILAGDSIGALKSGCLVLNTARASLVDWPSLRSALDAGRVAGYLVDVYDAEPPSNFVVPSHPLVLASSHLGAYTEESIRRAGDLAVNKLIDYLAGRSVSAAGWPVLSRVNGDIFHPEKSLDRRGCVGLVDCASRRAL